MELTLPVTVNTVDANDTQIMPGRDGNQATTGGGHIITLRLGFAEDEFHGTCAHELAHAWQDEMWMPLPLDQAGFDGAERDGFANWISFEYYLAVGDVPMARRYLEASYQDRLGSPYREGLIRMLDRERQYGEYGVFYYAVHGRVP